MVLDQDRNNLDILLNELDVKGRRLLAGENADDYWVCQRHHSRQVFRADCRLRFFSAGCSEIVVLPGRTRNLSRGGIGVLVRRPFVAGEAVEVEVCIPGQSVMYLAGLVQFVRYAGRSFHELGIGLKNAGHEPVFSGNPTAAIESLDWLRDSMRTIQT